MASLGPIEPNDLSAGEQLGDFLLERRIGKGGMGEVFAARHAQTGELVALKLLVNASPQLRYRFKREFRALADVEHPNLIRLGELMMPESGPSFFTMELLVGDPFVRWARKSKAPDELPDLDQLESGLRQLVEGLICLHDHQCVHRDLKPSNVMVTEEGRVVILDFGVIRELSEADEGITRAGQVLGTPAYMAPEQAAGVSVGRPADYYALGVMLYQCLTGQLPYVGSALKQLVDRQAEDTPDPGLVLEVPTRLRELCMALLQIDPSDRPSGPELLARLGVTAPRATRAAPFVGRRTELEFLAKAFADQGRPPHALTVWLRGHSGLGKSTLVRQFLDHERSAVVLRGRCRERETVPYKGVDAVIDALAIQLRRMPARTLRDFRPRHVGALVRVFPVLDELWPIELNDEIELSPQDARNLGWASLRTILTRLAEQCRLVVLIDDFQWADLDGVALLRALTRQPEAPAMLLLIVARETASADNVGWLADDDGVRTLDLGPLPESDAHALAHDLLLAQADSFDSSIRASLPSRADAVVLRCRGNPFYIAQMALGGDADDTDLDQLVVRRFKELEGPALRLIEVVAVAGGPMSQPLAVALSEASDEHVERLCELAFLVRSVSGESRIETAHDRIRELALAGLDSKRRRELHWAIAEGLLARRRPEPAGDEVLAIVEHFDSALTHESVLSSEQRLEIARLSQRAGERALAAAAWTSARRYLDLGFRLIQPWLSEARAGRGPRDLCLAIAFGRAQVEAMNQVEVADAAFEDLLGWPLSDAETGRIVARRVEILYAANRLSEALDLGLARLAGLGVKLPRNPSVMHGLLEVALGWWTLGRLNLEALRGLPEIHDERALARLDILNAVSLSAYLDGHPTLFMLLAGHAARGIRRYGYHTGTSRTLATLAFLLLVIGYPTVAEELAERALQLFELRTTHPRDMLATRVHAISLVRPVVRPWHELQHELDVTCRDALDQGDLYAAGLCATVHVIALLSGGMPIPELLPVIERHESNNPGFGAVFLQHTISVYQQFLRVFLDGSPMASTDDPDAIPYNRLNSEGMQMFADLIQEDHARAISLMDRIAADYETLLAGLSLIPLFAMCFAVLEAERTPASGHLRRASLRRIRRYVATARRWASKGPDNFGVLADIAEAELLAATGRIEQALQAHERARKSASALGKRYLEGLASMRLAQLARRHGLDLIADSAFSAGLTAYEAWGAKALVAKLRKRGPIRAA